MDAAGALHRGIVRGIERTRIFQDDHDRNDFLSRLSTIIKETDTRSCASVEGDVSPPDRIRLNYQTPTEVFRQVLRGAL